MENNDLLLVSYHTLKLREKQANARKGALVLQVVATIVLAACAAGVTLINKGAL